MSILWARKVIHSVGLDVCSRGIGRKRSRSFGSCHRYQSMNIVHSLDLSSFPGQLTCHTKGKTLILSKKRSTLNRPRAFRRVFRRITFHKLLIVRDCRCNAVNGKLNNLVCGCDPNPMLLIPVSTRWYSIIMLIHVPGRYRQVCLLASLKVKRPCKALQ